MKVRKIAMPVPFEKRTVQYINNDILDDSKPLMGRTNPETWKFIKEGYVVLRNFIPKDVLNMTLDTWKTVEASQDWDNAIMYREENDLTHSTPEHQKNKSKGGYNTPWGVALHRWLKDALGNVIDLDLGETYSYSRRYERGAYLTAHTDRPSCEVSTTLCLDYNTDDGTPWKIWVQNDQDYIDWSQTDLLEVTQKIPSKKRTLGKCITLEPGDVLVYQGPNVPHWRDTFLGDYSYHIFCHFINRQSNHVGLPHGSIGKSLGGAGSVPEPSVLEYDGRGNRYNPIDEDTEDRKKFMKFSEFWDTRFFREYADKVPNNLGRRFFCNYYDHLQLVSDVKGNKEE